MPLARFYDPVVSGMDGRTLGMEPEVPVMTMVRRPSPFGELLSLRQAMDRLLEDSVVRPRGWGGSDGSAVALDIRTTPDALLIEAPLPGVKPGDVEITVEEGVLTIRGENRAEAPEDETVLVQEIRRGVFTRSVTLPSGLEPDRAEATFEDGVLFLRIPKAEQVKPRHIRITSMSNGQHDKAQAPTQGEQA
jgi:HSP20 family protein